MAHALRNFVDRFLGRGSSAVTVPPLDGALKPNSRIEQAPPGFSIPQPDNIALVGGTLLYSSGVQINTLDGNTVLTMAGVVTAMAASASGLLAVASQGGGIDILAGDYTRQPVTWSDTAALACVTAMAFVDDRTLLVCTGSSKNGFDDWQRDLLDHGHSGALWRLDVTTGKVAKIIGNLAFPYGVVADGDGSFIVSESWHKRLVRVSAAGKIVGQVLEDLPGYPARISGNGRGGYWLSVFAPRSQLIEFVLHEPEYRRVMMAEVDPQYWIAPALRSGVSYREPMQGGALRQMGILKPWAPTRSYGLVVELDGKFVPVRSLHSRADGKRHGITSAVEQDGRLWLTSKGGDEVISVDLDGQVD